MGNRGVDASPAAPATLGVLGQARKPASSPCHLWSGVWVHILSSAVSQNLELTVDSDCSHEIKRQLLLGRKAMTNLDSVLKKQSYHFANKGPCSQSYGFSSSHVQM